MTDLVARNTWATLQEAAAYWRLSVKTIRRYIASGQIEARRVGARAIRVNLDSLEAMGRPLNGGGASE